MNKWMTDSKPKKYRFKISEGQVGEPKQQEHERRLEACQCGLQMSLAAKVLLESSRGQLRLLYIEGKPVLFSADEVKPEFRCLSVAPESRGKCCFQSVEKNQSTNEQ